MAQVIAPLSMRRRPIIHPIRPEQRNKDYRTICEVQRELYRLIMRAVEDQPLASSLIELVEESYDLGKRMDKKLREYKADYEAEVFEPYLAGDDKLTQEGACSDSSPTNTGN